MGSVEPPTLPDSCPLGKLHRKRVAQNRDLTVLISDWNLERGSGKTTLALRLAAACDRTDEGITDEKATLSAQQLTDAYTSQPTGSALVLDEGQADASNRRAMSGVNEALRKIVGMGRVERKYLFLTSPGAHMLDRDIRNMCDIWIFVREVGDSQMFRVKYDPFNQNELTHDWGRLQWPGELPGQLSSVYDNLTKEKRKRIRGNGGDGDGYVKSSEVQDTVEQARKEAHQQARNDMIRKLYESNDDMTQQELADVVGLSRGHVANILRRD